MLVREKLTLRERKRERERESFLSLTKHKLRMFIFFRGLWPWHFNQNLYYGFISSFVSLFSLPYNISASYFYASFANLFLPPRFYVKLNDTKKLQVNDDKRVITYKFRFMNTNKFLASFFLHPHSLCFIFILLYRCIKRGKNKKKFKSFTLEFKRWKVVTDLTNR